MIPPMKRFFALSRRRLNYSLDVTTLAGDVRNKEKITSVLGFKTLDSRESYVCARFLLEAANNKFNSFSPLEYNELLIKASEFADVIEKETHENLYLVSIIAFLLHDAEKMVSQYQKLRKRYYLGFRQLSTTDMLLFIMYSSHLGKWSDLHHYIGIIKESMTNFLDQYQSQLEQDRDSYNYASIIQLSQGVSDLSIVPLYEKYSFEYFKVHHVVTKQTRPDISMPEVESRDNESEEGWVAVEHEIPNLIVFGAGVAWFQLNGEIHLSGIRSQNFETITVKGRGTHEGEEDYSHFTSEYHFIHVGNLEFEGTHTRSILNESSEKKEKYQQTSTYKMKCKLVKIAQ